MKVCLIGNNLTSLILAYILSQKNFSVTIYYSKSIKSNFETRSLGIADHNLKYLESYFKNISEITNNINEIKVLVKNKNKNENKEIIFNKKNTTLFNMVNYNQILTYVKSKIRMKKNVSQKCLNRKIDLNFFNKTKFNLIINCERTNNLTNKYLKNGLTKNYNNKAFTTFIRHEKIKNNRATQIFTDNGPIAFLPLSEKITSVVFSYDMNKNKSVSEKEIQKKIEQNNPCYKILSSKKIQNFNLNLKLPRKYYFKNILFFGDSIHSIHPLAGQGFNMTLRDIARLDKLLDNRISLGLPIDKNIYKEFENKTKSYNLTFSLGVDLIYEFFKIDRKLIPNLISKKMFNFINKSQKIKDLGINFANQGRL